MNNTPKNPKRHICEKCNFKCFNKKDYSRHLLTSKHTILINANEITPKNPKSYNCACGKKYKHLSSLHKHKKICSLISNSMVVVDDPEEKPSMMDFITQNKEIMDLLVAQNKEQAAIIYL